MFSGTVIFWALIVSILTIRREIWIMTGIGEENMLTSQGYDGGQFRISILLPILQQFYIIFLCHAEHSMY